MLVGRQLKWDGPTKPNEMLNSVKRLHLLHRTACYTTRVVVQIPPSEACDLQ